MRQGNNSRRSRGRGNGKRQSRGNNHIDSHGPEVRVRGSAQQVCTKYIALARDAASAGDRISAENLYQHAEHYFRVMGHSQEQAQEKNGNGADTNNGTQNGKGTKTGKSGTSAIEPNVEMGSNPEESVVIDPSLEVEDQTEEIVSPAEPT